MSRRTYNYDDCYVLLKDMPGFEAGTIFQHRDHDRDRDLGSPMSGYLTNIWIEGNCQESRKHIGWCGETFILPGQLKDDDEWFRPVKLIGHEEKPARYYVDDLVFEEVSD